MVLVVPGSNCKYKVGRQRQCVSRCLSLLLHCRITRNTTTLLLSFGSFYVASGNVETERVGLALQSDAQVELHYSKE